MTTLTHGTVPLTEWSVNALLDRLVELSADGDDPATAGHVVAVRAELAYRATGAIPAPRSVEDRAARLAALGFPTLARLLVESQDPAGPGRR